MGSVCIACARKVDMCCACVATQCAFSATPTLCGAVRCGVVRFGLVRFGAVWWWCGLVRRCGVVRGAVWCGAGGGGAVDATVRCAVRGPVRFRAVCA